ncbi:hypothetical protein Dtox_0117 [Desulfofarcimen acetoxidans DSM 771]|uniref:Uncharacterized protein n=1 Tax=Desulfofarcimen acetoxidans (strain ATCC 49208 / DSM 771 / KCTC 5769 / VKM B-1644 / 5575) TaxID=485916 RepID=C8W2S4_DESAS|nr:hypothetical protein Dtox_0117 [Desulfofarcimen acetoxidans DSM 771]
MFAVRQEAIPKALPHKLALYMVRRATNNWGGDHPKLRLTEIVWDLLPFWQQAVVDETGSSHLLGGGWSTGLNNIGGG